MIAKQKLSPCEFKCLMVLFDGEERTKAQISSILNDTPQHIGTAMIRLEKLGLIIHTRTEGRNSFFKANTDFSANKQQNTDQFQFN